MNLFLSALKYVKSTIWKDEHSLGQIFDLAKKAFDCAKQDCTYGKRFFRLAGQSGSGKTSQLYYATSKYCSQKNIKPLHLAVRNFCEYYPDYQSIPVKQRREKTNGFCLKMLLFVLKFALESGIDIILEIALLGKNFEKYIIFMLKKQNYHSIFQIMSVNKLISDILLFKRKLKSGRQTLSSSANYFFCVQNKSFKYVSKNFDCPAIVWSAFNFEPVYFGSLKTCRKDFFKNQKRIESMTKNEDELKNEKFNFLISQFPDGAF